MSQSPYYNMSWDLENIHTSGMDTKTKFINVFEVTGLCNRKYKAQSVDSF